MGNKRRVASNNIMTYGIHYKEPSIASEGNLQLIHHHWIPPSSLPHHPLPPPPKSFPPSLPHGPPQLNIHNLYRNSEKWLLPSKILSHLLYLVLVWSEDCKYYHPTDFCFIASHDTNHIHEYYSEVYLVLFILDQVIIDQSLGLKTGVHTHGEIMATDPPTNGLRNATKIKEAYWMNWPHSLREVCLGRIIRSTLGQDGELHHLTFLMGWLSSPSKCIYSTHMHMHAQCFPIILAFWLITSHSTS